MPKVKMFEGEHAFAQYVRILGKGKTGSRNLTRQESQDAMRMILSDQVEDVQLGAFMMLMRYQEESGEELAGFVDASHECFSVPSNMPKVDLDWSSYAGKSRRLPWFILSNLLLAQNGISVLMHGAGGHTPGRIYTEDVLDELGVPMAKSFSEAGEQIKSKNFAYMPLGTFLPKLHEIIDLKPILGLRSPVNTFVRLINPCQADCTIQGIHHPGYRDFHHDAAVLLNQKRMCVMKGDGGETEWNPDMPNLVRSSIDGEALEETWQPLFKKKHVRNPDLSLSQLAGVWSGELDDEYAVGAITGTLAITLYTMGRAKTHEAAISMAESMWTERSVNYY